MERWENEQNNSKIYMEIIKNGEKEIQDIDKEKIEI